MAKSMAMNAFLEAMFPEQTQRRAQGLCSTCGGTVSRFRDTLSENEFRISGMCQKCQDDIFTLDPEDDR